MQWFRNQLLPNIKPGSTIVIDNAPYHSVRLEKNPSSSWKKEEIVEWLKTKNINLEGNMNKAELLELCKFHKPQFPVDEVAKQNGHRVLRLPPYHCHFNPIELIWAQVKGYVADKNRTFKMSDVRNLTDEKINLITSREWKNAVEHVRKEIKKQCELDGILEGRVEEMIIHIGSGSSSSGSSTSEEESEEDFTSEMEVSLAEDSVPSTSGGISGIYPLPE